MSKAGDKEGPLIKAVLTKLVWILVSRKFIALVLATYLLVHDHISDGVWEIIALGFIGAIVIEKAVEKRYKSRS